MEEGLFVVRQLNGSPEHTERRVVTSVRYPPQELPNAVVSELELWEVEANISGYCSLSYWRSVFNRRPDYNIILQQRDLDPQGQVDASATFVLHESSALESSQRAFEEIRSTLEPLVDDCTVMMTEKLLKEIITPRPREASRLAFDVVEIMEKNPGAHPNWTTVLQSIVKPALQSGNEEEIQLLLNRGMELGTTNRRGKSILHRAASGGTRKGVKKVIESAGSEEEKQKLLQQTDKDGKTCLHIAFEEDNPDAVCELLEAGAGLSKPVAGSEDSSNPLHLAAERGHSRTIYAASNKKDGFVVKNHSDNPQHIDFMNALNTTNRKGFTPLMLAVRKGHLHSALSLVAAGADPDVCHPETGNTALHYAAEAGNQSLVKLLVVYGADINIKNEAGKTPLVLARSSDAAVCIEILNDIAELQDKNYGLSNSFEPGSVSEDAIFLLSMDGGGVKGLVTSQTLIALEKRMKQLQPDCGPLHSYFDYIAGTSAGAIIGLAISHAKASPEICRNICLKFAVDVCSGTPTFHGHVMDTCLKESYGAKLKFYNDDKPRVIMTTVLGDMDPPILHLMCNYDEMRDKEMHARDWMAWEVARASAAAPVYLPPYMERYIDGGVMSNNPTLDAMTEIFQQGKREGEHVRLGLVFSIGTGIMPGAKLKDVGVHVPRLGNLLQSLIHIGSTISGLLNLINQFISQSTQSHGQEVERAEAWCMSMNTHYIRLSPKMSMIYDMAESDKGVLVQLIYESHIYILKNATQIDIVAKVLLSRGPRK